MKTILQFLILLFITACNFQDKATDKPLWIISAPSGDEFAKIDREGKTVIPNGRYIIPAGKSIVTAPHPYGLTLSPDGNIAVTANSGTSPLSITIIRDLLSQHPEVQQVPPGPVTDAGVLAPYLWDWPYHLIIKQFMWLVDRRTKYICLMWFLFFLRQTK